MNKEPRLKFTQEERADPQLEESIRKAEKAAARADKAQARLPKKAAKPTGKASERLCFEETDKPPSKLSHALRDAPAHLLAQGVHRQLRSDEDENVGVESAHKSEAAAEAGARLIREGRRSHRLRPYRKAAQAERQLEKANINALYQKALREHPQQACDPVSRWQQKQAIKKQYAAAKRAQRSASRQAAGAARAVKQETSRAVQFVVRHRKGILLVILLLLLTSLMLGVMASCSMLFNSMGSAVAGSTYPSQDADMIGAEAAYADREHELQVYLDTYSATHSYDEYHFELDEIRHDPYVLISLITAYQGGQWTLDEVNASLQVLFDRQYTLTENVVKEVRYRTEGGIDAEGNSYTEQVPYDYFICTVTLKNADLSHLPVYLLTEDQLSQYAVYMATLGNRPDLFPHDAYPNASEHKEYEDYDIPPEALADQDFAAMIQEAEKYLGYPYVWGGASPSTSFDCSGFVSWVVDHSGWDLGRLTAQGLFEACTPVSEANVKPGDLVFFEGTYDTPGYSHVGIYVGEGRMIHCGDPISYTSIRSQYWQDHFGCYARLPEKE